MHSTITPLAMMVSSIAMSFVVLFQLWTSLHVRSSPALAVTLPAMVLVPTLMTLYHVLLYQQKQIDDLRVQLSYAVHKTLPAESRDK